MNARSAEVSEPVFAVAEKMILTPSGLDEGRLSTVLDAVMSRGVDYADLYFQLSREESWSLEDGIVKDGSHSIEQGVGVRAISGEEIKKSAVARLQATGILQTTATRSRALTSGSCGCGSSGSHKNTSRSISPSAMRAPICWSPP